MPNVLIEATACGLPIVVNRYAAYEEIIGPNNLISSNEQQFTKSLLQLIDDPKQRRIRQRQNLDRAKLFDIRQNIKQWINVIEPETK